MKLSVPSDITNQNFNVKKYTNAWFDKCWSYTLLVVMLNFSEQLPDGFGETLLQVGEYIL